MLTTAQKGDIGVARIIADLTENGFNVLLPISESLTFDLVVYSKDHDKFYKVQVKYVSETDGVLKVPLKTCSTNTKKVRNKSYKEGSFDILAVYSPDYPKCLYIPYEKVKHLSSNICIRITKPIVNSGSHYNYVGMFTELDFIKSK